MANIVKRRRRRHQVDRDIGDVAVSADNYHDCITASDQLQLSTVVCRQRTMHQHRIDE